MRQRDGVTQRIVRRREEGVGVDVKRVAVVQEANGFDLSGLGEGRDQRSGRGARSKRCVIVGVAAVGKCYYRSCLTCTQSAPVSASVSMERDASASV